MMEKSPLAGEGGVHAHPLSLYLCTITYKVAIYAPAKEGRYTSSISTLPYMYSVEEIGEDTV
jgi:hypothetical protein